MPRNISFFLTQEQIRNQTKTVTRRIGWDFLKPGDVLNACVKCQGLGKGGKVERICQIRVRSVRPESLSLLYRPEYGVREARLEGFPKLGGKDFVKMFCMHMGCDRHAVVNRIEFEYLPTEGEKP